VVKSTRVFFLFACSAADWASVGCLFDDPDPVDETGVGVALRIRIRVEIRGMRVRRRSVHEPQKIE